MSLPDLPPSGRPQPLLAKCQDLLSNNAALLARHQYLLKQISILRKTLLSLEQEKKEGLDKEKDKLETIEQKLESLRSDKWLDKLFSVAKKDQEVEEIERYMQRWGVGRPEQKFATPAHCMVWHANKHGDGDILKYLRKANAFNKKHAKRKWVRGAKRWIRKNGEFLIERDGKIVSYGMNKF